MKEVIGYIFLFSVCYIIVLIGYKLWGFEMSVLGLLSIISFNSFFIKK